MTAALILVTCLASGGDCRPHLQADNLGLLECQIQSQRVAAAWAIEHPKRRVAKIICADRRRIDFYLGRGAA